jgi:uncharacterized protein YndB with AHSA1/START domain
VSAYRQQCLFDAPVEAVWREVGDPARYPAWAGEIVEVTDLDHLQEGARYRQTMKTPFGKSETDFEVEALDDLHEIRVRCMVSGYYMRWVLTEAADDTYAEVEIGMDPKRLGDRAFDATLGRRWYRRTVEDMLERLRAVIR